MVPDQAEVELEGWTRRGTEVGVVKEMDVEVDVEVERVEVEVVEAEEVEGVEEVGEQWGSPVEERRVLKRSWWCTLQQPLPMAARLAERYVWQVSVCYRCRRFY